MRLRLTYGLLILLALASCRSDFDVTAEYEEIPVVYGLLDIQDSVHYIRIQRAYLDKNTSALVQAQHPDSIYYPDVLDVFITPGQSKEQIPLDRVMAADVGLDKEPGLFDTENHVLYRFEHPLQKDLDYELHIFNRLTGKTTTAETDVIGSFTSFLPTDNYVMNWSGDTADVVGFRWEVKPNMSVFDLSMAFHFWEIDKVSGDTTAHSLDFSIVHNRLTNIFSQDFFVSPTYRSELFYIQVSNHLEPRNNIYRVADKIEFRLTAGGEHLGKLIANQQVQQGITGNMALDRYTNVDDGIGIFSSRYTQTFENIIGRTTRDSLALGRYTHHLGFQ